MVPFPAARALHPKLASTRLVIDEFTATTALETFLGGGQALFLQEQPYPCTSCCDDRVYPPTRPDDDGNSHGNSTAAQLSLL